MAGGAVLLIDGSEGACLGTADKGEGKQDCCGGAFEVDKEGHVVEFEKMTSELTMGKDLLLANGVGIFIAALGAVVSV